MEHLEASKEVDKYSTLLYTYTYEEGADGFTMSLTDSSESDDAAAASAASGYSTAAALNASRSSAANISLELSNSDPGRLYHSLHTSLSDSSMSRRRVQQHPAAH